MNPAINYFNKIIFSVLPESRFFRFKESLLRLAGAKIGKNVNICSSVTIIGHGKLIIGDNVWVGHQTMIVTTSEIRMGSNIDIAPRVYIGTGTHEIDTKGDHSAGIGISKNIVIEDGVWIGTNSTILPGVSIGKKTVVAAGAVVTKSFGSYCIIGGVPAKLIKSF